MNTGAPILAGLIAAGCPFSWPSPAQPGWHLLHRLMNELGTYYPDALGAVLEQDRANPGRLRIESNPSKVFFHNESKSSGGGSKLNRKFVDFLNFARIWRAIPVDQKAPGPERHALDVYRRFTDKRLLVGHLSSERGEFVFRYDPGFTGTAISAFPDTGREYRSKHLWPFFTVRIPPFDREDMRNAMASRSLGKEQVIEILGSLAKVSATNPYELELVGNQST